MIESDSVLVVCAVAARCFGVLLSLPVGETIQSLPRLLLAIGWGVAVAPTVTHCQGAESALSALSCLWEFGMGMLLGAPLRFVVDTAELFGELIDTARGQTLSSVIDPLNGQGASDLAVLCRTAAAALAVHVGALELLAVDLRESYLFFPLGAPWRGVFEAGELFRWGLSIVELVLRTSAIWLVAFIMTDITAAIAARMIKGLQFTLAGSVVKCFLTVVLLGTLVSGVDATPHGTLQKMLFSARLGKSPGGNRPAGVTGD